MVLTFDERLKIVDKATLTPLIQNALGIEPIEILDWHFQSLHGGAGDLGTSTPGVGGIARFIGTACAQHNTVPWSLILKVLPPRTSTDDPYAETRELHAYQSGLLDRLPGNITAPRCFSILAEPGEAACMWIEDICDELGQKWPPSHYGLVARHFGQLNGAYLVDQALPTVPWLSRSFLRQWVAGQVDSVTKLTAAQVHPIIHHMYPSDVCDGIRRLWAERELFLDAIERLPQTFCHLDAFRRNLFVRKGSDGPPQTVAIDWAFAGIGAVGEEIAQLTWASLYFREVDLSNARELEEIVLAGYLEGLRDAGWHGSAQVVQFAYKTTALLRAGFPVEIGVFLDERCWDWIEHVSGGISVEEIVTTDGGNFRRALLCLANEARELMSCLDF